MLDKYFYVMSNPLEIKILLLLLHEWVMYDSHA